MGLKVQIVWFDQLPYFVCHATGILLRKRYFIPGKIRHGAFISLPVALRWLQDTAKLKTDALQEIKSHMCVYFDQPDIPMHPNEIEGPLGYTKSAQDIFDEMDMGENWTLVAGAETAEEYLDNLTSDPTLKKRQKTEGVGIDEAWWTLFG